MKIKICGIRRLEDADYLNEFMPDFAGLVFAPSVRRVTEEEAKRLRGRLDSRIKTVGVFVNEKAEVIEKLYSEGVIDIAQLHGDEDDFFVRRLKMPVIKAQRVKARSDIKEYGCEMYLFDTLAHGEYGGTGKVFDWSILEGVKKPFFLAGGISAENIREAALVKPYGLDVSSGAETNGFKDRQKIREIICKVRNLNE